MLLVAVPREADSPWGTMYEKELPLQRELSPAVGTSPMTSTG